MVEWILKTISLKEIKNHPNNPRQISKDQLRRLEELIDSFGLIDKPIVNADYTLIGGHQRIKLLKRKKQKEVECWVPDRQLEEKEVNKLCVGLNLNQGHFDFDVLANAFDLEDLLSYGFSEEQLLGLSKEIEEVPSEREEKSKAKKAKTCPSCGHEF